MEDQDFEGTAHVSFYVALIPDAAVVASHQTAIVSLKLHGAWNQLHIDRIERSWLEPSPEKIKIERPPV